MMPSPTAQLRNPERTSGRTRLSCALLVMVLLAALTMAQADGVWRLVVRQNVTRGEADRAAQALQGLPQLEVLELPNGSYAVYVGRYASQAEAERQMERFFEDQGIRLGSVAYVTAAGPTPTPPSTAATPTPQSTPAPTPAAQATPAAQPSSFTPPPASAGGGGAGLPWGIIIGAVAALVVIGAIVFFLMGRKKSAPAPVAAPVSARPVMAPPPSRPKPAVPASPVASRPEPKPAPKPEPPPPPKAAVAEGGGIRFDNPSSSGAVPVKAPIAMSDDEPAEQPPAILLNEIFEDEQEAPSRATAGSDEGPRLDFLFEDSSRPSAPAGNGSSGSSDEGFAVPSGPAVAASSGSSGSDSSASREVFAAVGAAGSVIFEQDLSKTTPGQIPSNWTGSYDYAKLVVASEENGNGERHLRFEKETGIGSAYFSCVFPEVRGRLTVDFEIRCDDKNKYLLGFYIEKDQDFRQSVHALIHRTNAKASPVLRLQNESVPYDFGTWRKVRYEIDLARHIIDGFVDGEPVIVGQRLTSCPDGLNTLSIRDNLATTGVLLLRRIRITSAE